MPTVVKNLLIINGLCFLGMFSIRNTFGIDITDWLGLYFPLSDSFLPVQLVSHVHARQYGPHLLQHDYVVVLGSAMENYWGQKRFLIYYLLTGLGASALQIGVNALEYFQLSTQLDGAAMDTILSKGGDIIDQGMNYTDPVWGAMNRLLHVPMVGASGAVFGVLLAFGMTFPNQVIYLNFFFPIKAKYFVIGYGLLELYNGFTVSNSGIAHFAHLGGMLFGYLLIKKWRREMYL